MPEPLKLKEIKLRMQAYGVRPKKKFGQNMLIDFNLLKAIVNDAGIIKDDCVIEIGTGAGSLTGYLCDQAGMVISVEIDRGMYAMSRDILETVPNILQINADALPEHGRGLNPEVESLIRGYLFEGELPESSETIANNVKGDPPGTEHLRLVANLPYSVATNVLIAVLESQLPVEMISVMVQHDVAEKIAAKHGHKNFGIPALLISRFAEARISRKVPAKVFWPKPKVESAILELTPRGDDIDMDAYHRLRRLAHVVFQSRRKAASNALSIALDVKNSEAAEWLKKVGIDPQLRAEHIDPEALQKLADDATVEPLVRKAMQLHEDQLAEKAAKRARREEWKARLQAEEE
ncbi:MAG: 16S rRNA (adenine(1518)-N(6)/adenine(1519)-N(6))-dimethyltransferase RsmA [Planctomycetota bacterium]|jgi:16S rRNA (adenine1518-N6/adenine1519-N6)-dimethyltransferase